MQKLGLDKLSKICDSFGVLLQYLLEEDNNITMLKEQQYNFIPDENIIIVVETGHVTKEQSEELKKLEERLYSDAFEKVLD